MLRTSVPAWVVAAFLIIAGTGCEKKSGEAVVIGKDYVAAVKEGDEVKDERATNHEQWIVKVRILYDDRGIVAWRRHPVALESLGESAGNL